MTQKLMKDNEGKEEYTLEIPAKYTVRNYIDLKMIYNVSIMDSLRPLNYSYKTSLIDQWLNSVPIATIVVKINLYHYIDRTDRDFYSFGDSFFNKESEEELLKEGRLYVSRDFQVTLRPISFPSPDIFATIQFVVDPILTRKVIHCASLLTGIAKVGGFLALLKFSVFLSFAHQRIFEHGANTSTELRAS